ncbi:amidohydrolase family protein [Celeribacter indicus]|uniref:imidazolonepropionase n=1 Tax=Celeribacter indicus TaxID=1208324 RepID=A0A0B5DZ50_9RHOB|nr:amidohydrolase family protein [Celeribacter indicus]AJE48683.1 imidazolonepropionase [Celeribacter indicus]SDX35676.1 imidazolonepropionase [Celeribacter indicus]
MHNSLLLTNLHLLTLEGETPATDPLPDAVVAIEDGQFTYAGPKAGFRGDLSAARDMGGALALPGLVACHAPLLWLGEAAPPASLDATEYRALARRVAEATTRADENALLSALDERIARLRRSGVTACELKCGFGATATDELRLTALLRRAAGDLPVQSRITLFIGHQFPEDSDPDEVLAGIETTIVPETYALGCADAVEVFCDEDAALDLDQCSTILELYYKKKTPSRVSCDRFEDAAGATLPASFYSRAATFLNHTDETGLDGLARVGTVAVLIPEAMERDTGAPAPRLDVLRASGARIALSVHAGPDGGDFDILAAMRAGYRRLGLTPAECLLGVTRHAARALGLDDSAGVIAPGRPADLALFGAQTPSDLVTGDADCLAVIRNGALEVFDQTLSQGLTANA